MNVPSPFQQRRQNNTQDGSIQGIPAPAVPIAPAANQPATPNFPGAVPPPAAPTAPTAPTAPKPVAQAPAPAADVTPAAPKVSPVTAAPAPVATPAPAAAPVPTFISEMMRKGQESLQKKVESAMAPAAPAAATTTPPSEDSTTTRRTTVETPTGSAQSTDTTTTAPTETPEQIAARAASMQSTEVQHNPDGSVKTDSNGQPLPATADYVVTETDTPEQVAEKQTAQQVQDALMEQAKKWMTATEDPAYRAQFNNLLIQSAIQNQATIDATKRQIAANPSLAGQPAGDAMLGLKAIQLGMSLDQMKATLTVEHAKAVADMNKYGFEAVYKLNQDKLTQDDKDALAYGNVLDRMISSGASEEELKAYYDKTIKPLLGGKDISFDQFRSPAERQALLSGVQDAGLTQMRDALDRNDLPGALAALESAYAPAKQVDLGSALIAKNDVATINQWLKDAGYDEIQSTADLIGREDDVFIAQQISQAKKKIDESPLQPKIDALLDVLKGRGMDITDPDILDSVNEYIYQQEFGDPEQTNVLPWDSDVTSYKYKDWEVFNPQTGTTIDKGNEFYDPTHNPEPAPGTAAYDWKTALDGAWQKYLTANPDSKSRLSRDDWFGQFKKDYTDFAKKNPDADLSEFLNGTGTGTGWVATPPKTETGDLTLTAADIKRTLNSADIATWIAKPENVNAAVDAGVVPYYNTPATMPSTKAEWNAIKTTGNTQGIVKIGDRTYQLDQSGGSAVRNIGGIGDVVILTDPVTKEKFVMKVNSNGPSAGQEIGYMVPVGADGTWKFSATGATRDLNGKVVDKSDKEKKQDAANKAVANR